jgi:hypothetical protein
MSAHSRPTNSERVKVAGRSRHDSSDGDASASDKVWTESHEMEVRLYKFQLISTDTRHCVQFTVVVNMPVFYGAFVVAVCVYVCEWPEGSRNWHHHSEEGDRGLDLVFK